MEMCRIMGGDMDLIHKIQFTSCLIFIIGLSFCMFGPKNPDRLPPGVLLTWGIFFFGSSAVFIASLVIEIFL